MNRTDGTSARQLDLDLELGFEDDAAPDFRMAPAERPRAALRLIRRDVYAELARRRRRAQIAARHELEKA